MCGRNVSLLSRVTPSVLTLTVSESGTAVPARSMLESKGKARRHCHKPNNIASDLSGFMTKLLKQNHASETFTLQVLVYQTDDHCVTEQSGVGCQLHTVVAGFQSA